MMKRQNTQWKRLFTAFLSVAALTAILLSGPLTRVDNVLQDALYQRPQALDGNIVLIGIDDRAVAKLGRFGQWDRGVLARVLDILNADPDNRPAAIGVDVLFTGETEAEADAWLAETAGRHGNVITAASAIFEPRIVERANGEFYTDPHAVGAYDEPYAALRQSTAQGHINAMLDTDGVLRHALFQITLPDGRTVPSFHQQLYRLYAEKMGLDPERTPPMNSRSFWYVPFQARPGDYSEGISVAGILAGEEPADRFADKIVLIGPYTIGLQDAYTTAMDHAAPMYGVEYQANCIDAMIRGEFKVEVGLWPQAAALLIVSGLCLLWFWNRKVLPATVIWLAVTAASAGASLLAWQGGYVLYVLYIPLAATVLYIATVAMNYIRAAMEKQAVTNTFKRYVAPEIVSELLKEGSDSLGLGGKLTDIAVLFVDIRGFTTMSELLQPGEVVEILNRYLTLTSACILQNGGTMDKFVGDCTMAFWGAPLPQEDCVYKAVKTGMDMVEGAKALSSELLERFGRTVDFGIGIHFGPAIVGNIGAPNRMDYTAIGDTVNTASRLEANAPGGTVLVSRAVAEALTGRVRFTSLGDSIRLKGKAAGFEILRVEGLETAAEETQK